MLKHELLADDNEELDLIMEANQEHITVDTESGTIYIFKQIDDSIALETIQTIDAFNQMDDLEEIHIVINSSGGLATSAIAICEKLLASPKPIRTTGVGKVFSAAVPMLACGTKGRREVTQRIFAMIHQPFITSQSLTSNQSKELSKGMEILTKFFQDLCGIHSTDEQKKKIAKFMKIGEDKFLVGEQLVELGIADIII